MADADVNLMSWTSITRVASGHLDSFLPDSVDKSRKEQFSLCVPPVPQSFLVEPCINQ